MDAEQDRSEIEEPDATEETLAAIDEAEAELNRGEGIPLPVAFAELRKKHVK